MTSDQVPEKPYFIPGHFDLLVNRHERELDFYIAQLSCLLDQRKKLDEEIDSVSISLAARRSKGVFGDGDCRL